MKNNICVELVEAVAYAEDTDPLELNYTLQDYIPVMAIEQLSEHENARWTLTFEIPNHDVTVTSDGLILIDGQKIRV